MLSKILVTGALLTTPLLAGTREIPYTGGVQTGVVHLKGMRTSSATLPDTVVFDGGPRLAVFVEDFSPLMCGLDNPGYWFSLGNTASAGMRKTLDTVWTNATTFPTTPLRIDTLQRYQRPGSTVWQPVNHAQMNGGFKIAAKKYDPECVHHIESQSGFKRVVYFTWTKSGQTRYGKLMARNLALYTPPPPHTNLTSIDLDSVEVAYTLFDSASLDPTPMSLRSLPPQAKAQVNLLWSERDGLRLRDAQGRLYNLHGRRLPAAHP